MTWTRLLCEVTLDDLASLRPGVTAPSLHDRSQVRGESVC
jgi:hypothetical protein